MIENMTQKSEGTLKKIKDALIKLNKALRKGKK